MLPRDLADYGGPKVDAHPVSNPEAQVGADEWNREAEDLAQLTRTKAKAIVKFNTTAVATPPNVVYLAADVSHMSVWGSGDSTKPTVTKTTVGRYTVAYAAAYNDGLAVSENVSFFAATITVRSGTVSDMIFARPMTLSGATLTLMTFEFNAGVFTLVDQGSGSGAVFEVEVVLY